MQIANDSNSNTHDPLANLEDDAIQPHSQRNLGGHHEEEKKIGHKHLEP